MHVMGLLKTKKKMDDTIELDQNKCSRNLYYDTKTLMRQLKRLQVRVECRSCVQPEVVALFTAASRRGRFRECTQTRKA